MPNTGERTYFLIGRLVTCVLVGTTYIFIIPRLLSANPVEAMINRWT